MKGKLDGTSNTTTGGSTTVGSVFTPYKQFVEGIRQQDQPSPTSREQLDIQLIKNNAG
jgi:hypothetical protein